MDLIEKKLTLSDLLDKDRVDTEKMQLRRAIIFKLKREIAEEEGLLPTTESNVLDDAMPVASRDSIKKAIIECINKYSKPLRLSDIQNEVQSLFKDEVNVREYLRTMQSNKKLALMKINGNNRLAYWVKPEWIDKENNTLYDEYRVDVMTDNLEDKITFE